MVAPGSSMGTVGSDFAGRGTRGEGHLHRELEP